MTVQGIGAALSPAIGGWLALRFGIPRMLACGIGLQIAGLLMAIVASMVVQRTERGDLMFLTSATRHAQHALEVDAQEFLRPAGD